VAQRLDRRPGDKAGQELPQQRLARQKLEANLDSRTQEARRAMEKAQGGQEVDAEAAAQLQRSLGNSALQDMVKEGTDTATTSAEATLDEAREEDQEEEKESDEDKEAGEIEHVLPSFSTGGGGGGGGPGGTAPWHAHLFGGDGDDDGDDVGPIRPKWRPMPVPPDPDEEVELEEQASEATLPEEALASLEEADERLGVLPWAPGVLARGLRHPARLVCRRAFAADGTPDPVWARARAALRFLGEHAPDPGARALAEGGALLGAPEDTPLVLALAQELALAETALRPLDPGWHAVVDAAADQRARARCEAAAATIPTAQLSAATLLAVALDTRAEPNAEPPAERAHPAALAALFLAARPDALPHVEPWRRSAAANTESDQELAALDAILDEFTGGDREPLPPLGALYAQLDASLTALGALQVEGAAAALAAWPWLAEGVAEAALAELDAHVRRVARRLVAAGRLVQAAATEDDAHGVEQASAEAASVAASAAFVRTAVFAALGGPLLDPDAAVAPPPDDVWSTRMAAGRADALRPPLLAEAPLFAFGRRARLDGVAAAAAPLADLGGDAALLHAATIAALGQVGPAAFRAAGWVGEGEPGPYGLAWAALLAAFARRDAELLVAAAPTLWQAGDAGALSLLKAGWTELRLAVSDEPGPRGSGSDR